MQSHLPEGKANSVRFGEDAYMSMPAASLAYWRAHSFTIAVAITTGWHGQSETEEELS